MLGELGVQLEAVVLDHLMLRREQHGQILVKAMIE